MLSAPGMSCDSTAIPVNGGKGIYAEHKCTLNQEHSELVSIVNRLQAVIAGEGFYESELYYMEEVNAEIPFALPITTCSPHLFSGSPFHLQHQLRLHL